MAGRSGHRGFGAIKKLPSGRYHASYLGPDRTRHNGPSTFTAKVDAEGWLAQEQRRIATGEWMNPTERQAVKDSQNETFGAYAQMFLAERTLKPRTLQHYRSLVKNQLDPTFQDVPVRVITPHR